MRSRPCLALLFVLAASCSDDGGGSGEPAKGGSAGTGATSGAAGATSAGAAGGAGTSGTSGSGGASGAPAADAGACLAAGIYGSCKDNACYCLQGATVYQVCSAECTQPPDCGDAADLPGATPVCYPLNPGASQMICALVCQQSSDCPCGLTCMPSGVPNTMICAELQ